MMMEEAEEWRQMGRAKEARRRHRAAGREWQGERGLGGLQEWHSGCLTDQYF